MVSSRVKWNVCTLRLLVIGVFISVVGFGLETVGQESKKASNAGFRMSDKEKEPDADVAVFLLQISTQPIEIHADLAFRFLGSDRYLSRGMRMEILESLFLRSNESREKYKKKQYAGVTDSPSGLESMVADQRLDEHSIKLRVVEHVLEIDPFRSRQMFEEISKPQVESTGCSDDLDFDFSYHYLILRKIVLATFDSEAKARFEHVYYVSAKFDEMASPSELRPALDLILSFDGSKQEFEILLDGFARSMSKIKTDPIPFYFSVKYGRIVEAVSERLFPQIEKAGLNLENLSKPFRAYLVKQFAGRRCSKQQLGHSELESLVSSLSGRANLRISLEDLTPERVDLSDKSPEFWSSPSSQASLSGVKKLRFGTGKTELTESDKIEQKWLQDLQIFLEKMQSWRAEDEDSTESYIHQKSVIFLSLIEIVPAGQAYFEVLTQFSAFLGASSIIKESPATFLMYAKDLMRLGKNLKDERKLEYDRILTTTGDIFRLYNNLERFTS